MMKEDNMRTVLLAGAIVLLVLLVLNSAMLFSFKGLVSQRVAEAKELARPAVIEMTVIESGCTECFNITPLVDSIRRAGFNISSEKFLSENSKEAIGIISEYGITRLPAFLLKGEIDKISVQGFEKADDALLFRGVNPPYVNATSLVVIGSVEAIVVKTPECKLCADISTFVESLKQNGMFFKSVKEVNYADNIQLLQKYNITKVPAILLSEDVEAYQGILQKLTQSGIKKRSNEYVIESPAPYVDVKSGTTRGLVKLTMIDDESCNDCYDVNLHKNIITRIGIAINKENLWDVKSTEGTRLIARYNITKVPTIILTGDLEAYAGFDKLWRQVGSVESDGAYIFRAVDKLGRNVTYRNLNASDGGMDVAVAT